MSLLQLNDITVARGGRDLLAGLNLVVAAGELLWVRGPNGSGKSTLLRVMAGLMPPSDGKVVRSAPPQEQVAYLGHVSGFDPQAKVATTAKFWLSAASQSRVSDTLATNITGSRRMSELSAGQIRKLELLRLSGMERPLWILDEPFASLDADSRTALARTITAHLDGGGACIIASHADLPEFGREIRRLSIGAAAHA